METQLVRGSYESNVKTGTEHFFTASGRATGLHPLAVMLVILVGAKLGGLISALVAVPLLAGGWEILRVLWVEPNEIIQKRIAETPELKRHRQAQP